MEQPKTIKVFVSHASEDKDRFVRDFAMKLRASGIDAWVDEWEMLPGDSLVEKIFEEGIKNADAMVVVLSNTSVNKPWVREELSTGIVKRINQKIRVIPIVIDDCQVPESLQGTLWQKIPNLQNYDAEFAKVVSALYGITQKPPLGEAPKYRQSVIDKIPGISEIDTFVLRTACEISLEDGNQWVNTKKLFDALHAADLRDDDILESIRILKDRFLAKVTQVRSGEIAGFMITPHGFENYAKFFLDNFDKLVSDVLLAVINNNLLMDDKIAEHLGVAKILVEYLLDVLERRRLVKLMRFSGHVRVQEVTTQGLRFARQI